jgi:hypothetical protein
MFGLVFLSWFSCNGGVKIKLHRTRQEIRLEKFPSFGKKIQLAQERDLRDPRNRPILIQSMRAVRNSLIAFPFWTRTREEAVSDCFPIRETG